MLLNWKHMTMMQVVVSGKQHNSHRHLRPHRKVVHTHRLPVVVVVVRVWSFEGGDGEDAEEEHQTTKEEDFDDKRRRSIYRPFFFVYLL